MKSIGYDLRRATSLLMGVAVAVVLFGIGCTDTEGMVFDCEEHAHCLDGEACLGEVCVDAPVVGDACSQSLRGQKFGELICVDRQWTDITDLFCGGQGTEDAPWEVCSATTLNRVGLIEDYLLDHFALTEDVDMEALEDVGFGVIGDRDEPFSGVFDGGGHVVKNLQIYAGADADEVGLFGRLGADGQVRRLRLEDVDISAGQRVGALVGENQGTISNVFVTGAVSGDDFVGGLVGRNMGAISRSSAGVSVTAGERAAGGLAGQNQGEITDSYATGDVEGALLAGGLVGENNDQGLLLRTFATGAVEGERGRGGLVGEHSLDAQDTTESYWVVESSGATQSDGGSPLESLDELRYRRNFGSSWSFYQEGEADFVWVLGEDDTGLVRPFLRGEKTCGADGLTSCDTGVCLSDSEICVQCSTQPDEDGFGGGQGVADEPWRVCTQEQLKNVADNVDADFELYADIELTDFWSIDEIIGQDNPFVGVFDGQGYWVEDFGIDAYTDEPVGFFGTIGSDGEVRDLVLRGVEVRSDSDVVGGLAGRNEGKISGCAAGGTVGGKQFTGGLVGQNGGDITNARFDGEVEGTERVGGLVGQNEGHIADSVSTANVSGEQRLGGLAGYSHSIGEIIDSHATGDLEVMVTDIDGRVGGLVGDNKGLVMGSYAEGYVDGKNYTGGLIGHNEANISDSYATGDVDGRQYVGGLVGEHFGDFAISDSYATGDVEGTSANTGGLVGRTNAEITGSYATGDVFGTASLGGFVGDVMGGGEVDDCYAIGDVEAPTGAPLTSNTVGGFAGSNDGTVRNSYSIGEIRGPVNGGGFVGNNEGVIYDSYWDQTTSNVDTGFNVDEDANAHVSGLDTDEFSEAGAGDNFQSWSFPDIWKFGEAPDGEERPILEWQQ